ncbi:hypothetical protein [Paracidovorax anthurii]|uniref:hypothetical protein n=1 Tax=Paracidovorax anthurii TaxID=78229 RepID=UPI0011BE3A35|nr:hypothetical protein [Paracidovorax anthurii]
MYAFDRALLEQLAGRAPELFMHYGELEHSAGTSEGYQFSSGGAQFLAYLTGDPGARRVVFWRLDGSHRTSYGDVRLKTLLRDYRGRRGWHCHLAIDGNEEAPIETMVGMTPAETAALAAWAQAAALGRAESLVIHEL